eukprot:1147207-Pelagomonas_calceolata.AAC.1
MGIWRVIGSNRLHDLAARSILVFKSMPSGNKLVDIHDRMGMKMIAMVIMGGDIQPGCLVDWLVVGLSRPRMNP